MEVPRLAAFDDEQPAANPPLRRADSMALNRERLERSKTAQEPDDIEPRAAVVHFAEASPPQASQKQETDVQGQARRVNEDAEADTECGSDVLSTGGEERIDTLDDFDSQQANASFEQIMSAREESSEKTEQQPAAHSVYFQLLRRSPQTEINEVPVRRGLQEI